MKKKNKEYLVNEVPKHKKKSNAKGLPRADHKHTYETGLLYSYIHHKNFLNSGIDRVIECINPTKICVICGRVGKPDNDPIYYTDVQVNLPFVSHREELSEEALRLPKWYIEDWFDKFATRIDEVKK